MDTPLPLDLDRRVRLARREIRRTHQDWDTMAATPPIRDLIRDLVDHYSYDPDQSTVAAA